MQYLGVRANFLGPKRQGIVPNKNVSSVSTEVTKDLSSPSKAEKQGASCSQENENFRGCLKLPFFWGNIHVGKVSTVNPAHNIQVQYYSTKINK